MRLKNIASPVELYRIGDGKPRHLDPVCRMQLIAADANVTIDYAELSVYFCSRGCADLFLKSPETSLTLLAERSR